MNILIVDDDFLVTTSLKTIIEAESEIVVVATGSNGEEAIELYKQHCPDILLMDIRMEKMDGITAAKEIIKVSPDASILFLTTFLDDEYIMEALKIGVKGYILKQKFESIIPSLKAVKTGQTVFGEQIIDKLPDLLLDKPSSTLSDYNLTNREVEIVTAVADGLSNKEIAQRMFLSEGTVRNYISVLLEKLSLRDRTQLAIFYYKNKRATGF